MPYKFNDIPVINSRLGFIDSARIKNPIEIKELETYRDSGKIASAQPEESLPNGSFKQGQIWSTQNDEYMWFCTKVSLPDEWKNQRLILMFDLGESHTGLTGGYEAFIYINGQLWQGGDKNHCETYIDTEKTGLELDIKFRLWSGYYEKNHMFSYMKIGLWDKDADELYYSLKNLCLAHKVLPDENPVKYKLQALIMRTYAMVDTSYPDSDTFYDTVKQANEYVTRQLNSQEKIADTIVNCIGSTHIDVAWLWQYKHTREKAARSFSTVAKMMEEFAEYKFFMPQAQLYEYIKNDYPHIYKQIKQLAAEKRWEPSGGMWVESDCNVTSGESMVRQILVGTRFFEKEFGYKSTFLWLPDVFGYSWALPQILKKCEIDTFITTKLSWNEFNRIPFDTFYWKSADGSQVLTHFITTGNGTYNKDRYFATYNGEITADSVTNIWKKYLDKGLTNDLLLAYGYGDGGGGPTLEMLKNRRVLDKIPGMPQVKTQFVTEYLEGLHKKVAENENDTRIGVIEGELYFELHRGTYTSQAGVKKGNRKTEINLKNTEILATFASALDKNFAVYKQDDMNTAIKLMLKNQFHDVLPGSSVAGVYVDAKEEHAAANCTFDGIKTGALARLVAQKEDVFTALNLNSTQAPALVFVPCEKDVSFSDGVKTLPAVKVEGGYKVQAEVPAMSAVKIYAKPAQNQGAASITFDGKTAETPYYTINFKDGKICSLFDKKANRQVLKPDRFANEFLAYQDRPRDYEAWEIDVGYREKCEPLTDLQCFELAGQNALETKIKLCYSYRDSKLTQYITLFENSPEIRFETTVDWQQRQTLLKVSFPVDLRATSAIYDTAFGNTRRKITNNNSWEHAQFEVCAHKWADLSEPGYGASLLNDCKYGYDIDAGDMRLTLLKSAVYPDPNADAGMHEFAYSFMPHQGAFVDSQVEAFANQLNNPVFAVAGECKLDSFMAIDNQNVLVDAVKKAEDEDCVIIRLHEYKGSRGAVKLTLPVAVKSWCECNMLERQCGQEQTGEMCFDISPYEIKTLKVCLG